MKIDLEVLNQFVQSHPFELATGMIGTAAVTAAVQKSPLFTDAPTLRSFFSLTTGLVVGTGITFFALESGIESKLLFTVTTVALVALGLSNIVGQAKGAEAKTASSSAAANVSSSRKVESLPTSDTFPIEELVPEARRLASSIGKQTGKNFKSKQAEALKRGSMRIVQLCEKKYSSGGTKAQSSASTTHETADHVAELREQTIYLVSLAVLGKVSGREIREIKGIELFAESGNGTQPIEILNSRIPKNLDRKHPAALASLFSYSLRPLGLLKEFMDDGEFLEVDQASILTLKDKLKASRNYDLMKVIFLVLRNVANSASKDTAESIAVNMVSSFFGDLGDMGPQKIRPLARIIQIMIENQEELFSQGDKVSDLRGSQPPGKSPEGADAQVAGASVGSPRPSASAKADVVDVSLHIKKGYLDLLIERIRCEITSEGIFMKDGSEKDVNSLFSTLSKDPSSPFRPIAFAKAGVKLEGRRPTIENKEAVIRYILDKVQDIKTLTSLMKKVVRECYPGLLDNIKAELMRIFPLEESSDDSSVSDSMEQSMNLSKDQLSSLRRVIRSRSLEREKKEALKAIIGFLAEVAGNEFQNKMSPMSLATCMALNLYTPPDDSRVGHSHQLVLETGPMNKAVGAMIRHYQELFE